MVIKVCYREKIIQYTADVLIGLPAKETRLPEHAAASTTSTGYSEGFKQLRIKGLFNTRSVRLAVSNSLGAAGT